MASNDLSQDVIPEHQKAADPHRHERPLAWLHSDLPAPDSWRQSKEARLTC